MITINHFVIAKYFEAVDDVFTFGLYMDFASKCCWNCFTHAVPVNAKV